MLGGHTQVSLSEVRDQLKATLAPLLGGEPLLDQVIVSETLPLLGKVKSGSALVFDAGVTAIVVGLFVAVFDGLDADELGRDEVQV